MTAVAAPTAAPPMRWLTDPRFENRRTVLLATYRALHGHLRVSKAEELIKAAGLPKLDTSVSVAVDLLATADRWSDGHRDPAALVHLHADVYALTVPGRAAAIWLLDRARSERTD